MGLDYKKLIPNRNLRLKILELTSFIPDKIMIELQYWIKTGRRLNLKVPKRFTEKLQWYKLYYKDPIMVQCSDKYMVREYVKKKSLENILNEIYGVYDRAEDINFDILPNKFVLKRTNGGGGNDIIICKDKSKFDIDNAIKKMKKWTKQRNKGGGREWVYYETQPRIIVEKFIEAENDDLIDYKFFCFYGVPCYLYVINERKLGDKANLGIFDLKYNQLPYFRDDEERMFNPPSKPSNFEQMIKVASILSEEFPHVRVDLYNVKSRIIFGELTFFDGSGYHSYEPDEFDFILGEKFKLPA